MSRNPHQQYPAKIYVIYMSNHQFMVNKMYDSSVSVEHVLLNGGSLVVE